MSDEDFLHEVQAAFQFIPQDFKEQMDNVAITIADWPSDEDLEEEPNATPMSLFGLYHGVPRTDRYAYSSLPDKITIFKQPILHASSSEKEVKRLIRETVLHEIGHHFGLSDEDLRRINKY